MEADWDKDTETDGLIEADLETDGLIEAD